MKPAGTERNREIAEIKYGNASIALDDEIVLVQEEPDCHGHYGSYAAPKFSTDIAAAMELWEEMKAEVGTYPALIVMPDLVRCELTDENGFEHVHGCYDGETEADAISGAWLKWKEAK